eukprot:Lankesteria_metandrocarpae@DN10772_c0_g1_i1.p1
MLYHGGTNEMLVTDYGTRFWSRTSPSTVHEIPHYRVALLETCRKGTAESDTKFVYLKGNYWTGPSQKRVGVTARGLKSVPHMYESSDYMAILFHSWVIQKHDEISIAQFERHGLMLEISGGRNENMECYKIEHVRNWQSNMLTP